MTGECESGSCMHTTKGSCVSDEDRSEMCEMVGVFIFTHIDAILFHRNCFYHHIIEEKDNLEKKVREMEGEIWGYTPVSRLFLFSLQWW